MPVNIILGGDLLKRIHLFLWFISLALYGVSLVFFFMLMYKLVLDNIQRCLTMVVIATVFYMISNKLITHKKGFTSFQSFMFYKKCCKEGLTSSELCRKRSVKFKEIASSFESLKELDFDDILESYEIGNNFAHGKDYE